jgi:hypothetical protein
MVDSKATYTPTRTSLDKETSFGDEGIQETP